MRTDRQTDVMKLIVAFHNFVYVPKLYDPVNSSVGDFGISFLGYTGRCKTILVTSHYVVYRRLGFSSNLAEMSEQISLSSVFDKQNAVLINYLLHPQNK
jgi:hypothetical protein